MLIDGADAAARQRRHLRAAQPARRHGRHARAGGGAAPMRTAPSRPRPRPSRPGAATGPSERRALLLKAADALEAQAPQFIEAVAAETGATAPVGRLQRHAGGRHAARGGVADDADRRRGHPVRRARLAGDGRPRSRPACVLGIAPWNAPVILGVRAIATPLACGNTVVLKGIGAVPAHPPADRRGAARGGLPGRAW